MCRRDWRRRGREIAVGDDLERNIATQPRIVSAVHDPHAAVPDLLDDFVGSESGERLHALSVRGEPSLPASDACAYEDIRLGKLICNGRSYDCRAREPRRAPCPPRAAAYRPPSVPRRGGILFRCLALDADAHGF